MQEIAVRAGLAAVKSVIAVASGKGGVGKSTVAVNLAVALARLGLVAGLLDADIHGPSLPRMLGAGRPDMRDGCMIPPERWGISCMSIGLLVAEDSAMAWRGPMLAGALTRMLEQTIWGALDVLVVDLPPGTGDVQLTLAQKAALAGAVIVSTPQDIALLDARRAMAMFAQIGVPVLGIVENMSWFDCPECGARAEIFGHGGAAAAAARCGVALLGEIPLLPAIRETADLGTPIAAAPGGAAAAFMAIARAIAGRLATRPAPLRIRIEE